MFTIIEANQGAKSLFRPGSGFSENNKYGQLEKITKQQYVLNPSPDLIHLFTAKSSLKSDFCSSKPHAVPSKTAG